MSRHVKVAVTLPPEMFSRLERARKQRGGSRSQAVAEAIRAWLDRLEEGARAAAYCEAYRRMPETRDDARAAAAAATRLLAQEPWE